MYEVLFYQDAKPPTHFHQKSKLKNPPFQAPTWLVDPEIGQYSGFCYLKPAQTLLKSKLGSRTIISTHGLYHRRYEPSPAVFPRKPTVLFLPEGKLRTLFHLTASGQATTDREAVQHLYGPDARPEEKKFLMLKKELEDRITNQLLQRGTQTNTVPSGKEAWDRIPGIKLWCRRQMILAEMLLTHHLHQHAEKILLKVSKQAETLLFYFILEESWLLLRQVYMLKGDAKKIIAHNEKIATLQEEKQRISQASGWYELLQVRANSTIARSESLAKEAQHDATTIAQWLSETKDPYLELYYYRIRTIEYIHRSDTEALQALIEKKAAFIKRHRRFRNLPHLAEITLHRAFLCQAGGNLRSALRYAERGLTFQNLPWKPIASHTRKKPLSST